MYNMFDDMIDMYFEEIIPHLYLANINGINQHNIVNNNISLIINLSNEITKYHNLCETLNININDSIGTDISKYFYLVDAIHNKIKHNKNVIVHCLYAVSRSATITIAYLIKYENMSFLNAYKHIVSKKSDIKPNIGFINHLAIYELELHHKLYSVPSFTPWEFMGMSSNDYKEYARENKYLLYLFNKLNINNIQ